MPPSERKAPVFATVVCTEACPVRVRINICSCACQVFAKTSLLSNQTDPWTTCLSIPLRTSPLTCWPFDHRCLYWNDSVSSAAEPGKYLLIVNLVDLSALICWFSDSSYSCCCCYFQGIGKATVARPFPPSSDKWRSCASWQCLRGVWK